MLVVFALLLPAAFGSAAAASPERTVHAATDPLPVPEMVEEGLKVLVIGVSGVFLFLVIMVVVVTGYSWLVRKLGLDRADDPLLVPGGAAAPPETVPVAAISAAVSAYMRATDSAKNSQ
jgi:sodium pump decarboxylase gamma subunit